MALRAGTLLVGGGPGGLAPLIAASRSSMLQDLLSNGLVLADRSDRIGDGEIGRYLINSDSSAETFLSCVVGNPEPRLAALADHPTARAIALFGRGAVPLALVGEFLRLVGEVMARVIEDAPSGRVLMQHRAMWTRQMPGGGWFTRLQCVLTGDEKDVVSGGVLLATGAHQPLDRLETEEVAGAPLLPDHRDRLMQSGEALTSKGMADIARRLEGISDPRIVIVGGSTSAIACARLLLTSLARPLGAGSVTVMHRSALTVFYPSEAAARLDGYAAFGPDDICPVSGFVFRFGGLRFDSRDLLMQALGIGDAASEERLSLHRLRNAGASIGGCTDDVEAHRRPEPEESRRLLASADLIISCLGYRPRALPVLDVRGEPIALMAHQPDGRMVGPETGVLARDGREIAGLFGIGLAAGFRPGKELGGEPSFTGQVNGLWLWQNDVGALVARRLLTASRHVPDVADLTNSEPASARHAAKRPEEMVEWRQGAGTMRHDFAAIPPSKAERVPAATFDGRQSAAG